MARIGSVRLCERLVAVCRWRHDAVPRVSRQWVMLCSKSVKEEKGAAWPPLPHSSTWLITHSPSHEDTDTGEDNVPSAHHHRPADAAVPRSCALAAGKYCIRGR